MLFNNVRGSSRLYCTYRRSSFIYVPTARTMEISDGREFVDFLTRNKTITCLTGAGISTESGIPDYRSKGVGLYDRKNHKPIQHNDFIRSEKWRQRYWARNYARGMTKIKDVAACLPTNIMLIRAFK